MRSVTAVSQIATVPFQNQELALLFTTDSQPMVAMKPICENIGIDWRSQRKRIMRDTVLNSVVVMMTTTASDGKTYEFTCLPLDYLNGWLFGIDDKRIKKPEVRQRVLEYKRECYRVLADYWLHGQATNPRQQLPDLNYPAESWYQLNPQLNHRMAFKQARFHITADLLYGPDANTPISHLLTQLNHQGYDIKACRMELMAMRHHLETTRNALNNITRTAGLANSASLAFSIY
ncbi:P22_AR N-terminal domain-containing protein [Marinospirillum celere]|uniref:P22_AR N-terminal domain-containing protein n=1 Tax=Marinospirillum celere TaxID=1122252 RepID=A0A1I1DYJ1_9GAMM|nr:phage antirepressor N-terminal domain-containing protein [Marinospirillum celere]SFB80005.1 P22_AR N-terminal domain-containing protein [Marinospirillum celere]